MTEWVLRVNATSPPNHRLVALCTEGMRVSPIRSYLVEQPDGLLTPSINDVLLLEARATLDHFHGYEGVEYEEANLLPTSAITIDSRWGHNSQESLPTSAIPIHRSL